MNRNTKLSKKVIVKSPTEVIDLTSSIKTTLRKTIPKSLKRQVWETYIGHNYSGICTTGCGKIIDVFDFECGHILSVKNGGENCIENLKPICSLCNKSMGTQDLNEFALKYYKHDHMEII